MPSTEDLKITLEERLRARKRRVEEVQEKEIAEELLTDLDEELEEDYEEVESYETLISIAHDAGYDAYFEGAEIDENPYVLEESTDADNLYAASWKEGWMSSHQEGCILDVVLIAKKLVSAPDLAEATEQLGNLEEAITNLEEFSDLDTLIEVWGH